VVEALVSHDFPEHFIKGRRLIGAFFSAGLLDRQHRLIPQRAQQRQFLFRESRFRRPIAVGVDHRHRIILDASGKITKGSRIDPFAVPLRNARGDLRIVVSLIRISTPFDKAA
jgi:hypothetical protein